MGALRAERPHHVDLDYVVGGGGRFPVTIETVRENPVQMSLVRLDGCGLRTRRRTHAYSTTNYLPTV